MHKWQEQDPNQEILKETLKSNQDRSAWTCILLQPDPDLHQGILSLLQQKNYSENLVLYMLRIQLPYANKTQRDQLMQYAALEVMSQGMKPWHSLVYEYSKECNNLNYAGNLSSNANNPR